jgi:phosphohistidine phosphatase
MDKLKQLILVRHGKSSWGYENVADLDRPLKNVGISNTYLIGGKLKQDKVLPGTVISSPASRAIHTCIIMCRSLQYPVNQIQINPLVYEETERELNQFIKNMDSGVHSLMIVGHNPTLTSLSNYYLKEAIDNLPTSGVVVLSFRCNNWNMISRDNQVKEKLYLPKRI